MTQTHKGQQSLSIPLWKYPGLKLERAAKGNGQSCGQCDCDAWEGPPTCVHRQLVCHEGDGAPIASLGSSGVTHRTLFHGVSNYDETYGTMTKKLTMYTITVQNISSSFHQKWHSRCLDQILQWLTARSNIWPEKLTCSTTRNSVWQGIPMIREKNISLTLQIKALVQCMAQALNVTC